MSQPRTPVSPEVAKHLAGCAADELEEALRAAEAALTDPSHVYPYAFGFGTLHAAVVMAVRTLRGAAA